MRPAPQEIATSRRVRVKVKSHATLNNVNSGPVIHNSVEQQPPNGQHSSKPRPPQKTAEQQHLSEAARHQAMPQPALFSPKPGVRRGR